MKKREIVGEKGKTRRDIFVIFAALCDYFFEYFRFEFFEKIQLNCVGAALF